jgi:hypothetical protein
MAKTQLMKDIDVALDAIQKPVNWTTTALGKLEGYTNVDQIRADGLEINRNFTASPLDTRVATLTTAVAALRKRVDSWYASSGNRLKDMFNYKMFRKKRERARDFCQHMESTLGKFKPELANFQTAWDATSFTKQGPLVLKTCKEEVKGAVAAWDKVVAAYALFGRQATFEASIDQGMDDIDSTAKSTDPIKEEK